jgi:hypothetical protein
MYLIGWRKELCRLLSTDPLGYLGRRYIKLAASVSDDFPSTATVLAYVRPLTSWSSSGSVPQSSFFVPRVANFAQLAYLSQRHFGWDTAMVHKKFEAVIWEGACLRMLSDVRFFHISEYVIDTSYFRILPGQTLTATLSYSRCHLS